MKVEKFKDGVECYKYPDGDLHRDGDLPAIERNDGKMEWYKEGAKSEPPD